MARPRIGMTARKKRAAVLLGQGVKRGIVAAQLGIDVATISKWSQEDEFVQHVLKESDRQLAMAVPAARALVTDQLSDDNGWLAQGAARIIMQEQREVAGDGAQQIVIHFAEDDTAPGMPINDAEALDGADDA